MHCILVNDRQVGSVIHDMHRIAHIVSDGLSFAPPRPDAPLSTPAPS